MTTQIDNHFTDWLTSAFSLSELQAMSAGQREVMRDTFMAGVIVGVDGSIRDPHSEAEIYRSEIGSDAARTKARHCVQEAVIIKSAEN